MRQSLSKWRAGLLVAVSVLKNFHRDVPPEENIGEMPSLHLKHLKFSKKLWAFSSLSPVLLKNKTAFLTHGTKPFSRGYSG